jgi:hypothetical protein
MGWEWRAMPERREIDEHEISSVRVLPTMISSKVSRFTLKGIFLITIAVGMISSSGLTAEDIGVVLAGALR